MSNVPVSSLTVLGSVTASSDFLMSDGGGSQAPMSLVQPFIVQGLTNDDTLTFSANATTITSTAFLNNAAFTPDSSLTGNGTVTLPGGTTNAKMFVVHNTSAYNLTIAGTGSSVVVPGGTNALIKYTGTSTGCYIVATSAATSNLKVTDGTNTVNGATTLTIVGGAVSSTGTSSTNATLTVEAAPIAVLQGTTTLTSALAEIVLSTGVTATASGTGTITLAATGSGGEVEVIQGTTTLTTALDVLVLSTGITATASGTGTVTLTASGGGSGGGTVTVGDAIDGISLVGQTQFNRPALSAFTELYFASGSSATEYNTGSVKSGPITLAQNTNNTNIIALVKSHGYTVGEAFSIVAQINRTGFTQQSHTAGLFLYESATGKGYNIELRFAYSSNAAGYWLVYYTSTGGYDDSTSVAHPGVECTVATWIKFVYDGAGHFLIYVSPDGTPDSWYPLFTTGASITEWFTTFPDQAGIALCNGGQNKNAAMSLYNWYTTSP